ncbi:hypothetical protein PM082_018319 [Marasmius tenuissimus]|nr:hypothetical protein PM082_018319 [Marasmius tenuissimus]
MRMTLELTELSDSEVETEVTEPQAQALAPLAQVLPLAPLLANKRKAAPDGQSYNNKKCTIVRKAKIQESPSNALSARAIEQAIKPSQPTSVPIHTHKLDAAYSAHTGKLGTKKMGSLKEREAEYDVDDLVKKGFDHVKWNRVTPMPIVEAKNQVILCLVGCPNQADYLQDTKVAYQAMMSEGKQAGLVAHIAVCEKKKRGDFPAFTKGMTMGMGSKTPVLLATDKQCKGMGAILQRLTDTIAFKRISQYQNDFVYNHPKLSHIPRNFSNDNVFAAAAFNFGGKVCTFKHWDHLNWAFGWCAITALGYFVHTKSACLILWELKLVINFPSGSTVLIPSAVITHSNTQIAEGDECTSFTQYTASAIFRWADNGGMTEGELWETNFEAKLELAAQKSTVSSE